MNREPVVLLGFGTENEEVSRKQIVQLVPLLTKSVRHRSIQSTSHLRRCKSYVLDVDILDSVYLLLLNNKFVSYSHVEVSETEHYVLLQNRCIHVTLYTHVS